MVEESQLITYGIVGGAVAVSKGVGYVARRSKCFSQTKKKKLQDKFEDVKEIYTDVKNVVEENKALRRELTKLVDDNKQKQRVQKVKSRLQKLEQNIEQTQNILKQHSRRSSLPVLEPIVTNKKHQVDSEDINLLMEDSNSSFNDLEQQSIISRKKEVRKLKKIVNTLESEHK